MQEYAFARGVRAFPARVHPHSFLCYGSEADVLAAEIVENLGTALEQLASIRKELEA